MLSLTIVCICSGILAYVGGNPITYDDVRGTPYQVGYDHRAITINGVRTLLLSGALHYPRSTPGMWPYLMRMARNQGLNTIQTYVFWNMHEHKQGVLDFSGRANLSRFLEDAANAGLFVNLRIGPYVCAEWNYGGIPVWLHQIPGIKYRSNNTIWKTVMRQFLLEILDYVTPYLAKNGGPIILAQIENEYHGKDLAYLDWCGSLVSSELSAAEIPWIMCNGLAASSTIETCNACNCLDNGWIDHHRQTYPDKPMLFTKNEGWFQQWGQASTIRKTSDVAYSVAEWYADGGGYHAYYMWHGGNNYGRTAAAGITTMYADDACLHADGTPNEPKYSHLSRLQHILADHAEVLLSQDSPRVPVPFWWNGKRWRNSTEQFVYSYPPSLHFLINQFNASVVVHFRDQNISMAEKSVLIYDGHITLLWNSSDSSAISGGKSEIIPAVIGPLQWQTWSESNRSNLSIITSPIPLEQLNLTNDETIYLWYRRNITLKASQTVIVTVETRTANALLFFLDGQYLGEFDNHDHAEGNVKAVVAFDLSHFKTDQQYLFEILSISLGLSNAVGESHYEQKGIVGNVWLDGELLVDNETKTHFWAHQKGLIGEDLQIYTEQGSAKVIWDGQWMKAMNRPITWFQARFDLNNLTKEDINANPILLDAQGLNRGHAFINGNDLGLYWLIQGICSDQLCCCQHAQLNCLKPTQRYYHIPSDWLMRENNLITVFDDLGAPSPASVTVVQRVVVNN